jgi:hypothetical protein
MFTDLEGKNACNDFDKFGFGSKIGDSGHSAVQAWCSVRATTSAGKIGQDFAKTKTR